MQSKLCMKTIRIYGLNIEHSSQTSLISTGKLNLTPSTQKPPHQHPLTRTPANPPPFCN